VTYRFVKNRVAAVHTHTHNDFIPYQVNAIQISITLLYGGFIIIIMVNKRTRDIIILLLFLLLLYLRYSAYNTPTHNPSHTRPKSVYLLGINMIIIIIIIIYTIYGHSHNPCDIHIFR